MSAANNNKMIDISSLTTINWLKVEYNCPCQILVSPDVYDAYLNREQTNTTITGRAFNMANPLFQEMRRAPNKKVVSFAFFSGDYDKDIQPIYLRLKATISKYAITIKFANNKEQARLTNPTNFKFQPPRYRLW